MSEVYEDTIAAVSTAMAPGATAAARHLQHMGRRSCRHQHMGRRSRRLKHMRQCRHPNSHTSSFSGADALDGGDGCSLKNMSGNWGK